MRNSETILYNLSSNSQKKEYEFHRIYRLLYNKNLYYKAIEKLYKNKSSMIIDNFNETIIESIIAELKEEKYQPKPVKQIYIKDKIVQEVCRLIMNAIYESKFSEHSHGFRIMKNCHTALSDIDANFRNVSWFIGGDIKELFNDIDHHILIDIIRKNIKDERFIRLIYKFLRAGYLEDWRYNRTYSGTPQGSIIGQILVNIYLNELDQYIEQVIQPKYDESNLKSIQAIKEFNLCYDNSLDTLKSIKYVRYAGDFILGVAGSKQDCINIKEDIHKFLADRLKLKLSEGNTLIRHSSDKVKFLNYNITVSNTLLTKKNRMIQLLIPPGTIERIIVANKMVKDIDAKKWDILHRSYLVRLTDLEILTIYDAELRGLYNYYKMAENVNIKMWQLRYVMEYSCLKTYANKYKTHIGELKEKYRIGKQWGIQYGTSQLILINQFKRERKPNYNKNVDIKFGKS